MTDGDSVTMNTLCNSANGTFVTLDEYLPDTNQGRSEVLVRLGRDFEDRSKIISMDIARPPRVILGILPVSELPIGPQIL